MFVRLRTSPRFVTRFTVGRTKFVRLENGMGDQYYDDTTVTGPLEGEKSVPNRLCL